MNFPDSWATRTTERIMALWLNKLDRKKEPRPSTATYNSAFEAAYDILVNEEADRG